MVGRGEWGLRGCLGLSDPPQNGPGVAHLVGSQQRLAEGFPPVDGEPGTGYLHPPAWQTVENNDILGKITQKKAPAPCEGRGHVGSCPPPSSCPTAKRRRGVWGHQEEPSGTANKGQGLNSAPCHAPEAASGLPDGNKQGRAGLGTPLKAGSTHASTLGKSCSLLGKISDSSTRTKGRPRARRRDSRCCRRGKKKHRGERFIGSGEPRPTPSPQHVGKAPELCPAGPGCV